MNHPSIIKIILLTKTVIQSSIVIQSNTANSTIFSEDGMSKISLAGWALYMKHGVGTEPQFFQILLLIHLISSSGEVAHQFEWTFGNFAHPAIDLLDIAFLCKSKDEDFALLVPYFDGTALQFC